MHEELAACRAAQRAHGEAVLQARRTPIPVSSKVLNPTPHQAFTNTPAHTPTLPPPSPPATLPTHVQAEAKAELLASQMCMTQDSAVRLTIIYPCGLSKVQTLPHGTTSQHPLHTPTRNPTHTRTGGSGGGAAR